MEAISQGDTNSVLIRTFASTVEHVPLFAPLTRFLKHNIQSAFNDKQRGYLRQVAFLSRVAVGSQG